MSAIKFFAVAALHAAALTSCNAKTIPAYAPAVIHYRYEALVWSDPAALLPADQVDDACRAWHVMGIRCQMTSDPDFATLVVTMEDDVPCAYGDDGFPSNGVTWKGHRELAFRFRCFSKGGDNWNEDVFASVARQAFGRAFGITVTVPPSCIVDDETTDMPRDETGRYICGPALMNLAPDVDIRRPTPADALAFASRDVRRGALRRINR